MINLLLLVICKLHEKIVPSISFKLASLFVFLGSTKKPQQETLEFSLTLHSSPRCTAEVVVVEAGA